MHMLVPLRNWHRGALAGCVNAEFEEQGNKQRAGARMRAHAHTHTHHKRGDEAKFEKTWMADREMMFSKLKDTPGFRFGQLVRRDKTADDEVPSRFPFES
eukprot:3356570-Amphidinium_carterae.1